VVELTPRADFSRELECRRSAKRAEEWNLRRMIETRGAGP
jgi:hypothetical protein